MSDRDSRPDEDQDPRPGHGSPEKADAAGPGGADDASPDDPQRPRRHRADETLRSDALPDAVRCPHCGETESEQFATFGSAVSVSQYYCRSCRTVFEFMKWR